MRVTNKMMVEQILSNLNQNRERLLTIQNQLASGKIISKPSDDPIGTAKVLDFKATIANLEQYRRNAEDADSWLIATEAALSHANNVLVTARTLAVQGANDTLTAEDREMIGRQVDQLFQQMVHIANTAHGGRHIFAGHETLTVPFDADGNYHGDNGKIEYEIGQHIAITVNLNGEELFKAGTDIFAVLKALKDALYNNDLEGIQTQLSKLDEAQDQVMKFQAEVGSKINRLEMIKGRLEDTKINITELLSKTEDVDIAEAITALSMQEATYRAALAVGARIMQPSLLDFLR